MIDPRVASGLRDILPSAMIPRERMLEVFRKTFASFGFLPIETPHIERMEVLTGKGAGSEEVLRQIFEVTNTGGTPGELALRFDLTVPLARFVARHVDELGSPFKRYAIGSVFRGERPAKGRFREFVQCDFDTVGTESPVADAETVQVIHAALTAAGVPPFTIALNERKILDAFLETIEFTEFARGPGGKEFVSGHILRAIDKREKIGRQGVRQELLTKFRYGIKSEGVGETATFQRAEDARHGSDGLPLLREEQAEQILNFIEQGRGGPEVLESVSGEFAANPKASEGISRLRTVFELLAAAGVPGDRIRVDLGLARGLDYYTGVIFETTVDGWQHFGSISSGGRYDNLASLFTGRKLPGVGASIGLDRLLALMGEAGWLAEATAPAPVLVASFPGTDPRESVRLASRLRAAGIGAEVYPDPIQVGKQLGYGSTRGHKLAVIVGPDEQARGVFNLRDLATRTERKGIAWADLEAAVAGALVPPERTAS